MAFGGFKAGQTNQTMAEINMIPLIDVMLVLLVIFIISAPLLTHAVKVNLPKAASESVSAKPDDIQLSIDARGQVWWNSEPVDRATWRKHMASVAATQPQSNVQIRADGNLAYRHVVEVMSDTAKAGLTRIGFITDPRIDPHEAP